MRSRFAASTKPRYCSASRRIEIRRRSTFWLRASVSSRSSGPSKPSTSTTSASAASRAAVRARRRRSPQACARPPAPPAPRSSAPGSVAASAARRAAPRRPAPAPRPASAGRRLGHRRHLVGVAVAVQDHVAAGAERAVRPLGEAAAQRLHRQVVGHQQPAEADLLADQPDHRRRLRRRRRRGRARDRRRARSSPSAGRRAPGTARSPPPARRGSAATTGSSRWLSSARAALPRHVLHHRQDAAGEQPLGDGPADGGHLRRIAAVAAVAEHRVGLAAAPRRAPARSSTSMPTRAARRRSAGSAGASPAPAARGRAAARIPRAPAPIPARAGARSRATRPPSWSTSTGASRPTLSRRSAVSRRSCAGSSTLRAKRMKPHGSAAAKNAAPPRRAPGRRSRR